MLFQSLSALPPARLLSFCLASLLLLSVNDCFFRFARAQNSSPQSPPSAPSSVVELHKIVPLPGDLDDVPVLNSNSPEQVQEEGILVSTCAPAGKAHPEAHLNYQFKGRFDIFAHHVAKGKADNLRTLYLGVVLSNPGAQKANVKVLSGASYLSQPDAPFVAKSPIEPNDDNSVFAGPGSRVMSDVLRNRRAEWLPERLTIAPGASVVLASLPIPVKALTPPLNGRSLLVRLSSSAPICASTVAMYAPPAGTANDTAAKSVIVNEAAGATAEAFVAPVVCGERPPKDSEWIAMLHNAPLAGPREKPASAPQAAGPLVYGRVAGVSKGSSWNCTLGDPFGFPGAGGKQPSVTVPDPAQPLSFPIASLERGTFATGSVQSAPLLVRYPDTAYKANGNYSTRYRITIPLVNRASSEREVSILLQSPVKNDTAQESLTFYDPPPTRVFFRGTVLVVYADDDGAEQRKYYHLVMNQGQHGSPLVKLHLKAGERRIVQVEFLYPPDATPPQVLTIESKI